MDPGGSQAVMVNPKWFEQTRYKHTEPCSRLVHNTAQALASERTSLETKCRLVAQVLAKWPLLCEKIALEVRVLKKDARKQRRNEKKKAERREKRLENEIPAAERAP